MSVLYALIHTAMFVLHDEYTDTKKMNPAPKTQTPDLIRALKRCQDLMDKLQDVTVDRCGRAFLDKFPLMNAVARTRSPRPQPIDCTPTGGWNRKTSLGSRSGWSILRWPRARGRRPKHTAHEPQKPRVFSLHALKWQKRLN